MVIKFRTYIAEGLALLMLGLGSGAHAEEPKAKGSVQVSRPLSDVEMEGRATASCEALSIDDRLKYVFSRITSYQGEDGMPAMSSDGSYRDYGVDCAGHSDELNNYQFTLRTVRSKPGRNCKIDGMVSFSFEHEVLWFIVQIPDHKISSVGRQFSLLSAALPERGYGVRGMVAAARNCEMVMPKEKCSALADVLLDQTSAGFCELYMFEDMKKGI